AVVVFIVIVVLLQKFNGAAAAAAHNPEATAAANRFLFERTGFTHAALPGAPLEQQVAHSNQLAAQYAKTTSMDLELVRTVEGYTQYHTQNMGMSGSAYSIAAAWYVTFQGNPPTVFHLAEKDMNSASRRMKTGYKRDFTPLYSDELPINDPDLAARFKAWGNSAEWLNHILSVPEIKQNLLSHAEVDLAIFPDKISFSDPTQANLRSAMGGTSGMMAAAQNPMAIMETQIAYHDNMGHLLTTIARTMEVAPRPPV
ncbi:hypothetical protein KKF84_12160, partial [Myxococcota bacterium]|nr:hypothetical protein [Myxococcota bacterium]MBU1536068.1 hypothetical protein [Myxococcota bacterium]